MPERKITRRQALKMLLGASLGAASSCAGLPRIFSPEQDGSASIEYLVDRLLDSENDSQKIQMVAALIDAMGQYKLALRSSLNIHISLFNPTTQDPTEADIEYNLYQDNQGNELSKDQLRSLALSLISPEGIPGYIRTEIIVQYYSPIKEIAPDFSNFALKLPQKVYCQRDIYFRYQPAWPGSPGEILDIVERINCFAQPDSKKKPIITAWARRGNTPDQLFPILKKAYLGQEP